MSLTNSFRTTIIAADANLAVYTAGQPIYGNASAWGKDDSTILVAPGQIVFYNPATKLSTGEAATKSTVPLLKVGVAIDYDGDGVSDDIVWFNDGMTGCGLRNHAGKAPKCGLPNIRDFLIGDCIECGKTYTIEVVVTDPVTEAFGEKGEYIYHFAHTVKCGNCPNNDCTEAAPSPTELICGLYNQIKGITSDPSWDITLNNLPLPYDHEYRFDVTRLFDVDSPNHETVYEYCFTGVDGTCENCSNFTPAIKAYDWTDLESGPIAFSPATWVNAATDYSVEAHLKSVVSQLNAALGANGTAVYLPASGNCCTTNKIEVSTCLPGFALIDGTDTPISPCQQTDPFSSETVYSECQGCDAANTTWTPLAGLRFYSKSITGDCDCIAGNKVLAEYFSEVEVYAVGGFNLSDVRVYERQAATLPEGQGYQLQHLEIMSMEEGGREPFVVDNWGGRYGTPEANDMLSRITTNCKKSYCVISAVTDDRTRHDVTGAMNFMPQTLHLYIPKDNSTAITSFLTAWNGYFAGGDCGLASITCA